MGPAHDHPGFADPHYVRRRNHLADQARHHRVGDPSPHVEYTPAEHRTWRTVHRALLQAHQGRICQAVEEARDQAPIPADHIPQHAEVGEALTTLTGFSFTLAGGIVPNQRFLGSMADGHFHAVQYVRHPTMPLYTPEPDVIHDVLGHGTHLTSPLFADLYRTVGHAARRVHSDDALDLISRIYWHTLEYGLAHESGTIKAYGAALLSSYGELLRMHQAHIRPWNLHEIATRPYQVSGYQPVLYTVRSLDHLTQVLHDLLDDFDEDTRPRMGLPPLAERGLTGRPASNTH